MTAAIVSIALVLSPTPLAEHPQVEEPLWPTYTPLASIVPSEAVTSSWWTEEPDVAESSFAATEKPALLVEPPAPPPILSPIEQGINRLAELGATQFELRTFGCLGWYESKNNPYAVSPTGDYGWLQINQIHRWRWAGRDIFDTTVNAEVAWEIYRESGFRAWTTARLCGV